MISVIACYYDQLALIPAFWEGIRLNQELISRVIIVKDGKWKKGEASKVRTRPKELEELSVSLWYNDPKQKHGVGRSFNTGAMMAIQEDSEALLFFTSVDQVLAPGCLESSLQQLTEGRMVIGSVHGID